MCSGKFDFISDRVIEFIFLVYHVLKINMFNRNIISTAITFKFV